MFRRDFLAFLASLWPLSRLPRMSAVPVDPSPISSAPDPPPDFLGSVTEYHNEKITHILNPDFSTRAEMKGWFRIIGGPSDLNRLSVKIRDAALSRNPWESPIPGPMAGYRRVSLHFKVDVIRGTVHWESVDHEILS